MKATIYMKFKEDRSKRYPYGTYPYDTPTEKCYVNELAMRVRDERQCEIDIDKHEDLRKVVVE